MSVQTLKNNLNIIRQRIGDSAKKSGRVETDVKLVAVTKYVDVDATAKLIEAGHFVLGESRPQVLWDKAENLEAASEIEWHLIGHLQRNKVNRSLKYCALIHSVDSLRLLEAVNKSSGDLECSTNCLLEVNISGEPTKHGFQPGELENALVQAAAMRNIRIEGLMGMASLGGDQDLNRREFANLKTMQQKLSPFQTDNIHLIELSMGMSGDFEMAIEEGATIVRIGSILFEGIRN